MLKTTYTENGCYLDYLDVSLSDWLNTRRLVYLQAAASIYENQKAIATILLPRNSFNLDLLQTLRTETEEIGNISICDRDFIEVSLKGIWIASNESSQEGIFVCDMSDYIESYLYQMWQESQVGVSVIDEQRS